MEGSRKHAGKGMAAKRRLTSLSCVSSGLQAMRGITARAFGVA
jgi:hypothetical protein